MALSLTICLGPFLNAWTGDATPVVPIPPAEAILARLDRPHPRLLARAADFDRLQRTTGQDSTQKAWRAHLQQRADTLLTEAPSTYEIPDGLRLLSTSRRVVDRVYTLALIFRLTGERRYAERAAQELDAAAGFKDWNPRHFLDTAEMTHAFAIGYDWLFDCWSPEQKGRYRTAMVEKGLKPAVELLRKNTGFARARHNWNQVCNGGIGVGALALADEEPALARELLHLALKSIQLAMAEYAPDGAWAEGPGYWRYATSYNVVLLAALETALGTDFGLAAMPAFDLAGLFPIYITGPLDRTFNYADGGDGRIRSPEMFWLARRFQQPAYARYQVAMASPQPLDVLWYDPAIETDAAPALPLARYFRDAEVVSMRSAWGDRNALFVGFKAGDNRANHSHLDLGTFVLDALGVRWAVDLGADDYNLPAYFGNQRWTYYRLRAEGHNTLVVNPRAEPDQDPAAAGKMVDWKLNPDRSSAVADLTAAYAKHTRRVQRGIALLEGRQVLVQDELDALDPAEVWWFVHTPAEVRIRDDGRQATLRSAGQELEIEILAPPVASFTAMDARPLPGSPNPDRQNRNAGIRKLAIQFARVETLRLAVLFKPKHPGSDSGGATPRVTPLAAW